MFHVFSFTYYILLRCMMREYTMTSHSYNEKLLDLRDARVHYYYSLLERYMKHVFVTSLVTGVFYDILFALEICFWVFGDMHLILFHVWKIHTAAGDRKRKI